MATFEPVKLRSPEGDLHTAHTPRELNDLVFGHGYSVVGKRDVADVLPAGVAADGEPQTVAPAPKPQPAKKENDRG